jgi:Polysaccharide pyruvyl transferase
VRIAHIYPKYDPNIGDHFVKAGIDKLLRERLGSVTFDCYSNKRDAENPREPIGITRESVGLLNEHDLLVIGGSNLYEVSNGRWGVVVEAEALERLKVPVLLLGIGSGWSFAFPCLPRLPAEIERQIRRLHELAKGSSVRDDMTARVLRAHRIGPCVVTGCPATFLAEEPLRRTGSGRVGVAFLPKRMYAAGLRPSLWRSPTQARRRLLTRTFLGVLEGLRAGGFETRVLVHDARDLPLARKLVGNGVVYHEEPARMLEEIAACDVIVGFRLHASIAALSYGIPVIPILADGRSSAFAETFGLTELSVPLDPAGALLTMERIRLALDSGREFWQPALDRRDDLRRRMYGFLEVSLAG